MSRNYIYYLLLLLLIVALPLKMFPLFNFLERALRIDWVLMFLAIVFFIFYTLINGKIKGIKNSIFFWVSIFIVFCFLSISNPLRIGDKTHILEFFTTFSQYLLCAVAFIVFCLSELTPYKLSKIIKFSIFIALFIALFGVIQCIASSFRIDLYLESLNVKFQGSISGYGNYFQTIKRATSIFVEPRHFGVYLVTPLNILLINWISGNRQIYNSNWFYIISICILGGGIFLSFSVSAYFATVMGFLISVLICGGELKERVFRAPALYITFIIGLSILLGIIVLLRVDVLQFFISKLSVDTMNLSAYLDPDIKKFGVAKYLRGMVEALYIVYHNPICGIGLNQFENFYLPPFSHALPPAELIAGIGIPGTLSFVIFIYLFTIKIKKIKKRITKHNSVQYELLNFALIYIATALVKSLTGSLYSYGSTMFWFDMILAGIIYFTISTHSGPKRVETLKTK